MRTTVPIVDDHADFLRSAGRVAAGVDPPVPSLGPRRDADSYGHRLEGSKAHGFVAGSAFSGALLTGALG